MKTFKALFIFLIILNACQSKNGSISEQKNDVQNAPKIDQTDTIAFKLNRSLEKPNFNRVLIEGELYKQKYIFLLDNGCFSNMLDSDLFKKISNKWTVNENGYYLPKTKTEINFQNYSLNLDSIMPITNMKRIEAILGYDFFHDKIIEFDFKQNIIIIHSTLPKLESFIELPLLMVDSAIIEEHKRHRIIQIDGLLSSDKQEISCRFLLDFGCPMSILSPSLKRKINYNKKIYNINTLQYNLLKTLKPAQEDGGLRGYDGNDFFESNYATAWKIDGFIGVDFLVNYHLFMDYRNNKIYFKPNNL